MHPKSFSDLFIFHKATNEIELTKKNDDVVVNTREIDACARGVLVFCCGVCDDDVA